MIEELQNFTSLTNFMFFFSNGFHNFNDLSFVFRCALNELEFDDNDNDGVGCGGDDKISIISYACNTLFLFFVWSLKQLNRCFVSSSFFHINSSQLNAVLFYCCCASSLSETMVLHSYYYSCLRWQFAINKENKIEGKNWLKCVD